MAKARLQQLIQVTGSSIRELGGTISPKEVEDIAFAVHLAMEAPGRKFHNLDHVLGFLPASDPVYSLCAIFHDTVYANVDSAWPLGMEETGASIAKSPFAGQILSAKSTIPCYARILSIFDFQPGEPMPAKGLNEALSALIASHYLSPYLSERVILEIAVCIEATIPFRGTEAFDSLAAKARKAGLGEESASRAVERAVRFANNDVSDFRMDDPGEFLNNTWKLLPELNPALRLGTSYSIVEYRKALEGMRGFFTFLKPDMIFHSWENEPGTQTLKHWLERATENLVVARDYLDAKLLSACFLEAVAVLSGGDTPLSFFMGDPVDSLDEEVRIENLLPPALARSGKEMSTLARLLGTGRLDESGFDIKNSPLAYFFLNRIPDDEFQSVLAATRAYLKEEKSPSEFLDSVPEVVRLPLLKALARFAPTRGVEIEALFRT